LITFSLSRISSRHLKRTTFPPGPFPPVADFIHKRRRLDFPIASIPLSGRWPFTVLLYLLDFFCLLTGPYPFRLRLSGIKFSLNAFSCHIVPLGIRMARSFSFLEVLKVYRTDNEAVLSGNRVRTVLPLPYIPSQHRFPPSLQILFPLFLRAPPDPLLFMLAFSFSRPFFPPGLNPPPPPVRLSPVELKAFFLSLALWSMRSFPPERHLLFPKVFFPRR